MAKITSAKISRADGSTTDATTATPAKQASPKATTAPKKPIKTKTAEPTAPRKTATKSKPAARKTSASKTTKAQTSADIQSDLRKLEARLKRADTVTRKSVTALQTVVSTLDARLGSTTSAQKGLLTRHVNALSARLDDQTSKTRDLVRQDLKAALSAGGLDRLEAAVARSSARIDAAELAQADAVTKLNRHLADMARAVDARIAQEAADRARDIEGVNQRLEAAITETRSDLGARVDGVERDSAEALMRVGETIEQIHDKLETRRQGSADVVTEKVNELALQTQAEFEAYQAKLEARIAELEGQHQQLSGVAETAADRLRSQLEQQLIAMQARIDGLEREAAASVYAQTSPTIAPAPATAPDVNALLPMQSRMPETAPAQSRMPTQAMSDAMAQPVFQGGANDTNPYAAAIADAQTLPESVPATPRAPHEPVEFDPKAYASSPTAQVVAFAPVQAPVQHHAAPAPAPQPAMPPAPPMPIETARAAPVAPPAAAPVALPVAAPAPAASVNASPTPATLESFQSPDGPDFLPAPLPDVPYANPAYADTTDLEGDNGSPKAVRIGDDGGKRRKRRKKTAKSGSASSGLSRLPITPRNAKLGLLMVGVSAVGLFAAKSILGTDGVPAPAPDFVAQSGGADLTPRLGDPTTPPAQVAIVDPTQATVEPIGQYEEARALKIDRAQLGTLQAAVDAGDPIAQFQMGVAKLERAEDSDGAALIRMAADQDLAVALYQLGKLHETGRGVDADPVRARQLIERAARSGNRIAMHDLALYHTEGRGGAEASMLTARSWFEQAAQRGVVDSQFNLAVLSESAQSGLTPNTEDAYFWYTVAAAQGDKFATDRLAALEETLSAEARARVDARVADFTPRAIDETANGIFRDVPWLATAQGSADTSANRERTRTAQTLLTQLGFEVGAPDGIMGAKTRAAITEFERMNGLDETGEVSSALIGRLELATGA